MKHPHADIITEWVKDTSRVVQGRSANHQPWEDICHCTPTWMGSRQYRFKPEPKPDVVRRFYATPNGWMLHEHANIHKVNLRLTYDGETGQLKSAEVLE